MRTNNIIAEKKMFGSFNNNNNNNSLFNLQLIYNYVTHN